MELPSKAQKPTRIIQVSYGMTVNTGNYENTRFDLVAEVAPDEDWRDVLDALKRKAARLKSQIQSDAAAT